MQTREGTSTPITPAKNRKSQKGWAFYRDIFIMLLMGGLLYYGITPYLFLATNDPAIYLYYATKFWFGEKGLSIFPAGQYNFLHTSQHTYLTQAQLAHTLSTWHFPAQIIQFIQAQPSSQQPFHALPHEYPFLAIFPFSLTLLAPLHYSQIAFALGMILLAMVIYLLLRVYRSPSAALACACYLVIGGWATLAGRFDLVPAAFTLFALLCAERQRWNLAFALLAIATLLKLYPVYLLLPLLLAQQMATHTSWYQWRRWLPLGVYIGICTLVMLTSLLLSVEGTLAPFSYFGGRPIQIESSLASVLWLVDDVARHQQMSYAFTFGSLNVVSASAGLVATLGTVCMLIGLLFILWLQWRAKIDLATSMFLIVLLTIITAKVFSPQYILWVAPFAAYIGETRLRWLITWIVICGLTTWIYPFIYTMSPITKIGYLPLFHFATTLRNGLFLACVITLLIVASRKPARREKEPGETLADTPTVAKA